MTVTRLIARPMLASVFVMGGVNALKNSDRAAKEAEPLTEKVVPFARKYVPNLPSDPRTWVKVNAATHIVAGLGLATGRAPRLSALALAATTIPTTVAGHPFWEERDPQSKAEEKVHFFQNVSLLGGLVIAGLDTEGRPGLAWRAKHAAGGVRREAKHVRKAAKREARHARKSR